MSERPDTRPPEGSATNRRRRFLEQSSRLVMAAGLAGGFGGLASIAARFLYASGSDGRRWQFVAPVNELRVGDTLSFRGPAGDRIAITRQGAEDAAASFVALSSTCPHLGCQVHWEPQNVRYFCPCHNGAFDPDGTATAGPPFDAGQNLPRYPLEVDRGLLFVEVATTPLVAPLARRESADATRGSRRS